MSEVVMMSPITATSGCPPVLQTSTDPAGAASNASLLRLGNSPDAILARRSSRTGMARTVQAGPQNRLAFSESGWRPAKKRLLKPFLNSTAEIVGTAADRRRDLRSAGMSPNAFSMEPSQLLLSSLISVSHRLRKQ